MFSSAIFGIASLIISATATAYGVVTQIQTAKQQANLQRQQAQAQAQSLQQQAEQEQQNQLQRSLIERRQNMRKLAGAEASYAASGVSLAGTPTLSLATMAEEQELDVIMQESASNQKRQIMLTDAYNALQFGNAGASLTKSSGIASAVGTGLSGLANVGYKAYDISSYKGKK